MGFFRWESVQSNEEEDHWENQINCGGKGEEVNR